MGTSKRYPEEVRERAVRMVTEQQSEHGSQWAAINSTAVKIGCTSESLRRWVRQAERDHGERAVPGSAAATRTPMACCDSTSLREEICPFTRSRT